MSVLACWLPTRTQESLQACEVQEDAIATLLKEDEVFGYTHSLGPGTVAHRKPLWATACVRIPSRRC